MRNLLAAATHSAAALVALAGVAHASATIDLIWEETGTNEIFIDPAVDSFVRLQVIFTASPEGSEGASVSVDFSEIAADLLSIGYLNHPSEGNDSPLPLTIDFPALDETGTRVDKINSICICQLGFGTGLAAGESHMLGTVTFGFYSDYRAPDKGTYEFRSDAEGLGDGVLYGDSARDPDPTIFNSAFLNVITDAPPPPRDRRTPRWRYPRRP